MKLFQFIATQLQREANLADTDSPRADDLMLALGKIVKEHMPSGSGFDAGTALDISSTPDKLVFRTSFHHMNEVGMYDGWTEHMVVVRPSFTDPGFRLSSISGRDRNDIKEYIADTFSAALTESVDDIPILIERAASGSTSKHAKA